MAKNTLEAIRKSSHDVCNTYQTFMPNNYTPLSVTMFKITRHRQQCQVYVSGVNLKSGALCSKFTTTRQFENELHNY